MEKLIVAALKTIMGICYTSHGYLHEGLSTLSGNRLLVMFHHVHEEGCMALGGAEPTLISDDGDWGRDAD